jgi:hypothetical protein
MRKHPQRPAAAEKQQLSVDSNGAAVREPEVVRIELLGGFRLRVGPRVKEEGR